MKDNNSNSNNIYVLDMFPYPSGEGLHVGHPKGYIATDIYSRFKKMNGYNVVHPMGWDAFGLPAEQFALKNKTHPKAQTEKNVANFKKQLEKINLDYDWDRELSTTDPKFYKWTQWIFKQLYKKGLAYESFEPINWCPSCKTGLANEDLEGNACERCGTIVEKKPLRQWNLAITKYADRLIDDLDTLTLWPEHIKTAQKNWIGRSEGSEVEFRVKYIPSPGIQASPQNPGLSPDPNPQTQASPLAPLPRRGEQHPGYYTSDIKTYESLQTRAVEMRKSPTESEQLMWNILKDNFTSEHFRRQHVIGNFIVDFISLKHNLIIEIDGEIHNSQKERDEDRSKTLTDYGFNILRFSNEEVKTHFRSVVDRINESLNSSPLSLGEGSGVRPESREWERSEFAFTIFTTRADTLFGCTYTVLAPEHKLVRELMDKNIITNKGEVEKYLEEVKSKTDLERSVEGREKAGVRLDGVMAINPANNKEVPIYIADYVLASYGTGAIMAVPAHDERDYEFAIKYGIEIVDVVATLVGETLPESKEVYGSTVIAYDKNKNLWLQLVNLNNNEIWLPSGGKENDESYEECAIRELSEEAGIEKVDSLVKLGSPIITHYFNPNKNSNRKSFGHNYLALVDSDQKINLKNETHENFEVRWVTYDTLFNEMKGGATDCQHWLLALTRAKAYLESNKKLTSDDGILIGSGQFDGMTSAEARKAITENVGGKMVIKYKLREWVFARQRYWGEPFPIVYEADGQAPSPSGRAGEGMHHKSFVVADSELPILLPDVESYEPTGTGESPLANIKSFTDVYGYINDEGEFESVNGVHSDRELMTIEYYNNNSDEYKKHTVQTEEAIDDGLMAQLKMIAEEMKSLKVLEIGSGFGRDAQYLKKCGVNMECSDLVDSFKSDINSKGLDFKLLDPTLDDLGEKKYDGVIALASLLHCEKNNLIKIIRKINVSLNDDGMLYLRLSNGKGEIVKNNKGADRFFSLTDEKYLVKILSDSGFKINDLTLEMEDKFICIKATKANHLPPKLFKRETNTMPQWAGSSWYYLRFLDPNNNEVLIDPGIEKMYQGTDTGLTPDPSPKERGAGGTVDLYVGGDHATRHLIYARFWHKFLYDIGVVTTLEPFKRLEFLGFILAEDGRKMSKRWGNIINPDDIVAEYGPDTLRVYEMFMAPFEATAVWNTSSIKGVKRFLERVSKLKDKIQTQIQNTNPFTASRSFPKGSTGSGVPSPSLGEGAEGGRGCSNESIIHQTIKKVTEDIENFKFNTCVSQLMICLNEFESCGCSQEEYEKFMTILFPFAPTLAAEYKDHKWPEWDENKLQSDVITIALQISGKMRGTFDIALNASEEDIKSHIKSLDIYKKYVIDENGKETEPKKIIIVKNKIVNVVM